MNKNPRLKKCSKMYQRRMLFLVIPRKEGNMIWEQVQKILTLVWVDSLAEWVGSLVECDST
jgi:hypothetical protein